MHTFAMPLCCWQKALLEPHSVSGQLCACVLSKPLAHSPSVYTTLPQSTHWHTFGHFPPSVCWSLLLLFFFWTFCIFQSHFLPVFCCYLSSCCTNTVALFLSLVLWPEALCKATRKGLLTMLASVLLSIHFRSFPFFSVTCSHNCCWLQTHWSSYHLASGS